MSVCIAWQNDIQFMLGQAIIMLDFLAAPVDFQDVSKDVPPAGDILAAFEAEYQHLSSKFNKPIPAEACQVLDDKFFIDWTDQNLLHFHKDDGMDAMEYFASSMAREKKVYCHQLVQYWDALIMSCSPVAAVVLEKKTMTHWPHHQGLHACKTKALKHGLMHCLHLNSLLDQLPVPNKMFLYMLSKQPLHVQEGITEVALWIKPFSMVAVNQKPPMWCDHVHSVENIWKEKLQARSMDSCLMTIGTMQKLSKDKLDIKTTFLGKDFVNSTVKQFLETLHAEMIKQGVTPSKASKQMTLPAIADIPESSGEMEKVQRDFLWFLSDVFWHTSFPWMDPGHIKKPETLVNKLIPVFLSYEA
ncbi:hypothetical protein EDD17DRAFT_1511353 [Pisolithus thermaeus]|nr:hypothetical protein EV401DRAFT_1889344 [Pisolithus croceorrhizus]KAI6159431.1 hypothetical protein EDD17DRAFT_1511353 [Pisolithus thermaeus]